MELYGTLSKCEKWRLQSQYFPSKLGGYPAWLNPVNLPKESDLKCSKCMTVMTFVLQIYAPDDLCEENDAFHRMIYLFVCQPCGTEWSSFRCQLARKNDFYDYNPVDDKIIFTNDELIKSCCLACGLPSSSISTTPIDLTKLNIKMMYENSELRELHPRCKIAVTHETLMAVFDEWILDISEGDVACSTDFTHEEALYQKYLENKGKEEEMSESEEQAVESIQEERCPLDASFKKFCKKTTNADVLYYSREAEPLWLTDEMASAVGEEEEYLIPNCENCGSKRTFEFQVLPQLLHYLKNDRIDYGNVCVYTCSKSCKIDRIYQREYIIIEKDNSLRPKRKNELN